MLGVSNKMLIRIFNSTESLIVNYERD